MRGLGNLGIGTIIFLVGAIIYIVNLLLRLVPSARPIPVDGVDLMVLGIGLALLLKW